MMAGCLRRGVALLTAGLVVAACSGASEEPSTPVKNEGVFVHALESEPESLDPARAPAGGYGDRAIIQVYEFLVDIGPASPEPVPMLAAEVPTRENGGVSADGLTYTFKLRDDVTFHDGTKMTAEDVKYSWDRVMTMDLPEGQASTLSDTIASTKAVDDTTFEATLKEPAAWFLSSVVYSVPAAVVSKDAVEANGGVEEGRPNQWMDTHMVGTGPHKFVNWERNEQLNFDVFAEYWGEPAKLKARWVVAEEGGVSTLGMRAGDFDLVEPIPSYVSELQGADGACFDDKGFLLEPLHLAFNLRIPEGGLPSGDTIPTDFFHDPRVRQAFNYAFDYKAYVNGALQGFGQQASYLPPGVLGYSPEAPKYDQDLARAEALFRETGWWDRGFTVSAIVEDSATFSTLGLVLKDSLAKLNPKFRLNVRVVAESQFDEAHGKDPFEYAMWIKNADPFRDPHFYFQTYWHPDGEWGERLGYRQGYRDPDRIADLIDRAAVSNDNQERARLYGELMPLLHDDPMWVWAADERNVQVYRCWVNGFVYNPLWAMPRWRFYDKG
jgi:peptide/nickel transport system substrate-binding protein